MEIKEILQTYYKENGKRNTCERSELVKFFHENILDINKKQYRVQRIAIALSHIPTKDLYFIQSVFKDKKNRTGSESAIKWFWWSLK